MALDPKPDTPATGWTVSDYLELDDDQRYELLRGRLVVTPSPTFEHQSVLSALNFHIETHVRDRDLGVVLQAPLDVMFGDDTVVQPDLLYVAEDRVDDIRRGHALGGPPDLVVEVLSESTARRDRTEKREIYADEGVPWLVLVDPSERTVETFELADDGRYTLDASAAGDDTLTIGVFPELDIDLADVWFDDDS